MQQSYLLELTENKELLIKAQTKAFMIPMSADRGYAVLCREKEERINHVSKYM